MSNLIAMEKSVSVTKSNVIGWILTIVLSIIGAYGAINARLYEVEKKIELIQLQVDIDSQKIQEDQADRKEMQSMLYRIDKNLVELKGTINQKQDKYYEKVD